MKLAIISFTEHGSRLNDMLGQMLPIQGIDCDCYALEKYADRGHLQPLKESLKDWTKRMFREKDALLFISASGIAVRSIAPFLKGKDVDPAVVVMDEKGVFAISLVSGHLGGANELAGILANLTGAIPVITTATDVNGRFAVDMLARKQNLWISDLKAAKQISADILDELPVGILTEFPVIGAVPEELTVLQGGEQFEGTSGMVISLNEERKPFLHTLHLIPRIVTIGIGCRKEKEQEAIEQAVQEALRIAHVSMKSVEKICSITLKKDEPGILGLAKKWKLPFETFEAEKLMQTAGDFTKSEFVKKTTGVDCVCERSAVAGSMGGKIILKKRAGDGVTVALAVREWSVDFE